MFLSRVAFTKRFMYKVMFLGMLCEKDIFGQLFQMFAETYNLRCTCTRTVPVLYPYLYMSFDLVPWFKRSENIWLKRYVYIIWIRFYICEFTIFGSLEDI